MAGVLLGLFVAGGLNTDNDSTGQLGAKSASLTDASSPSISTAPAGNAIRLSDEGLYLLNGAQPVRKYRATTWRKVKTIDADTSQERTYEIPITQIIVTPSHGT